MLDEIGKFVLEELFTEALQGLFVRARSPLARGLKLAGWLCCMASIVSFVAAARWPHLVEPTAAIIIGVIAALVSLCFGFSASVINLRVVKSSA